MTACIDALRVTFYQHLNNSFIDTFNINKNTYHWQKSSSKNGFYKYK